MSHAGHTCHRRSDVDETVVCRVTTLCRLALRHHGSVLAGPDSQSALTDGLVSQPLPWRALRATGNHMLGNVKKSMLCFRRVAAVARVRCLGSARAVGACGPEGTSWRHRHTPAAADPLSLSNLSRPLLNGPKGTHGRYDCWTSVLTPHGAGPRVRQGSAATLRALLAPQSRGLCSGKPGEASPDGSTAPERKEDSSVPGHGLFKFKELVSVAVKVWCMSFCSSVVTETMTVETACWHKG